MSKASEVMKILHHVYHNNIALRSKGRPSVALEIIGHGGIGKTTMLLDFAKRLHINYVKINLAQIDELADIVGSPIREFKTQDGTWVNEKQIQNSSTKFQLTDEVRTGYCPPKWAPTDNTGGLLILDDWTRADDRFLAACMELIDRGEYYSWKLPDNWTVVLTSNPSDEGDYIVKTIDKAQKTRFLSIKMDFNLDDWTLWAELNNIDSRCINFVMLNPELINSKDVNPRAATKFFDSVSSIEDFDKNLDILSVLSDSLGKEFSTTFALCVTNRQDRIISMEKLFTCKDPVKEIKDSIKISNSKSIKTSVLAVICMRMVNYLKKLDKEKLLSKDIANTFCEISKADCIPREQQRLLVSRAATIQNHNIISLYSDEFFINCLKEIAV